MYAFIMEVIQMAFSELIKNFRHIREYMRQFYVYGFRSRTDFDRKSLRSYDDERRRVESWLGEYMGFSRTRDGKNIFLSIDSRAACHNPDKGIGQMVGGQMLRLVENRAHQDAQHTHQHRQNQILPAVH